MIIETTRGKMPIRYGMNALAMFGDLTGKSMNNVLSSLHKLTDLPLSEILAFVYSGFVDGARKAGEECKVKSIQEVGDMLDDEKDLLRKAIEAYVADSVVEGEKEPEDKKK